MQKSSHINVTIDFSKAGIGEAYDLRIPVHITVKQLLLNVMETLKLDVPNRSLAAIKVQNKQLLIADNDLLMDYPITDGDVLTVL